MRPKHAEGMKHYETSGLRELSRTPGFEDRKEAILEKAAPEFGFWARNRIHYVSSGFVGFYP